MWLDYSSAARGGGGRLGWTLSRLTMVTGGVGRDSFAKPLRTFEEEIENMFKNSCFYNIGLRSIVIKKRKERAATKKTGCDKAGRENRQI